MKDNRGQTTISAPDTLQRAKLRLVVLGDQTFATHHLPESGVVVLGRSDEADVTIDDPSVSRRHAEIRIGASITVRDLGSRNGTRVRGDVARDAVSLNAGDIFELGSVSVALQRVQEIAQEAHAEAPSVDLGEEMRRIHALADRIAQGTLSVLLLGETGVGKEVLADRIHRASPRRSKPFLRLNCGAFPEALLEAELFGHERGAFTGATRAKAGLLESAEGGTVLLDEVGDLPPTVQVKLLRVIEQKEVTRLGALEPRAIDVRFLAATSRKLDADVAAGKFRVDLLYRLNGATLSLPPLRERPTEIIQLARTFVFATCKQLDMAPVAIDKEAEQELLTHTWPGNVRELRNVMERAVLVCDGTIRVSDLAWPPRTPQDIAPPSIVPPASADPDRAHLLEVLDRFGGNQTKAAQHLGIARGTLIKRLEEHGIRRPRKA